VSGPDPVWHQQLSLRSRMVLIAAAAFGLVVVLAGTFIVLTVRAELIDAADEAGEARAEEVAKLARLDMLPPRLVAVEDVEAAVQVVRDDEVVSATPNAPGRDFFAVPEQPPGSDDVVQVAKLPLDDDGPFRVTALGTRTPQGNATVFVAVDVEDIDEAVGALVRQGAIGLALLLLAFSSVLWIVVGRTLGSVDAIRRRAEQITGHRLDQRVPEPAAKDEIYRLARTINDMLARLEVSATRQERFVADAAHELRTPLAALRARLETALARGDGAADELLLPDVLEEAVRMSSLVDRLLLLARGDAGMVRVNARPVDLDDVLRDVISSTRVGGVTVRVSDIRPVQVLGETSLLEQVFRNLLENAVRHARTAVEVSLTSDSENAVLTVDDDGPGIPPPVREEVFRRFVRLDDSRGRAQGGVGLGLAIVAEILRLHSGTVEVADSPTKGARLRVRLPLAATGGRLGREQSTPPPLAQPDVTTVSARPRRG
jgi:signal transduction histidine kinase